MLPSFWRALSALSIVAAVVVGIASFARHKKEVELGQQIFEHFNAAELFAASLNVRSAFLARVLEAENGEQLRINEQALAVALSRVKSSDAGKLFLRNIGPVLRESSHPKSVAEADALFRRWSIANAMSSGDLDELASKLASRIVTEKNGETFDALADALHGMAGRLSPSTADRLSRQIYGRIERDKSDRSQYALLSSLLGLGRSGDLALDLMRQLTPRGLDVLGREAREFEENIPPAKSEEMAEVLTIRLATEQNPVSVWALEELLEPLAPKIGAVETATVASKLFKRASWEWDDDTTLVLMSGFSIFAKKLDEATSQQLDAQISARIKLEPSAQRQAIYCVGLGSLVVGTDEDVASHLVAEIARERKESDLEALVSGLAALKLKAGEGNIALAATMLVKRILSERDLGVLVALTEALEKLDGAVRQKESEQLASEIVARIGIETNRSSILPLAISMDALDEEIGPQKAEELASKFLTRIQAEHDPDFLRALAVGMRFLKDKTSATKFEEAATLLAANMEQNSSPERSQILAFGLHSFVNKASAKPFERAADEIILQMSGTHDPAILDTLTQAMMAIKTSARNEQVEAAASVIIDRLAQQTQLEYIVSLTGDFRNIQDRLSTQAAKELAAHLVTRMLAEHDPARLRALGEALETFPKDSLGPGLVEQIAGAFQISKAPCGVVDNVLTNHRFPFVAKELLNPFCSESSWLRLAVALGEITHQPIVRGSIQSPIAEPDFDGMGALKDDDDDEGSKLEQPEEKIDVEFNLLSAVLEKTRPSEPLASRLSAGWIIGALMALGLVTGVLGYRSHEPVHPALTKVG